MTITTPKIDDNFDKRPVKTLKSVVDNYFSFLQNQMHYKPLKNRHGYNDIVTTHKIYDEILNTIEGDENLEDKFNNRLKEMSIDGGNVEVLDLRS